MIATGNFLLVILQNFEEFIFFDGLGNIVIRANLQSVNFIAGGTSRGENEDRHIVSNVVGTQDTHIEIGPRRKLSARDTLLIASDGLFDNLHTEEIVELIRKGPLRNAAQNLITCVSRRMEDPSEEHPCKPDDVTFVLFRVNS